MIFDNSISRNWNDIYHHMRDQKRSGEKKDRERLKNAYEHVNKKRDSLKNKK